MINPARQVMMKKAATERRRCCIPMMAFAEAEGAGGHKTRTWLSVSDEPVFACVGIWRYSDEWGPVYSVMITEPSEQARPVQNRMPVIIPLSCRHLWLAGEPSEAFDLCRPYGGELDIKRTDQPWVVRR